MMSQMQDEPVKTFSIGFEAGEYYNELGYARQVAECFGTEHREFTVSPNMVEDLPKLVWHWDEPFAVSSAIPVYYLSRMAREFVTVVMSGDGADEQFAGYSRYQWDLWSERLNVVPRPLLALLKAGVDLFPSAADAKVSNQVRRAQRYMDSLMRDKDSRYVSYFTFFDEVEKSLLYTKDFGAFCNRPSSAEVLARHYMQYSGGDLNRRLYGDIKTTLPDEMLTKVDRMSMAVGLEVRSPFMDHQLVEYVATLPARFKLRGKVPKFILKKALEGLVPDNILYRPKHGFEVPIDDWLRGSLKEYALDHLSPSVLRKGGIFNPDYVEKLLKIHMSGYRNLGHKIWILLVFQVWQKVMQRGYA